MAIFRDGQEINETNSEDYEIVINKWKLKSVVGIEEPTKPGLCIFNNIANAIELLNKHVEKDNKIVLHTDVDVDGIGSTYITKKILETQGSNNHILVINKDKVHGIMQKHVEYFKQNPIDLLIVTDSSSNEIELIKQFTCDVLCIDHHELLHRDLSGTCNDGIHKYVIINSTIDNENHDENVKWLKSKNLTAFDNVEKYNGTKQMSCGLVMYEFFRVYLSCYSNPVILENMMLYQWAGITLITDVIDTLTERNQWYMKKTVANTSVESSLGIMMKQINKFKCQLDKTFIGYSFAPIINRAIRAGASAEALSIVINNPANIMELMKYKKIQYDAVLKATTIVNKHGEVRNIVFNEPTIILDVTKLNIGVNYNGVIAARLGGDNNKNAAVYTITAAGKCKGSFRGKCKGIDYRKYFADYADNIYAQGHDTAFGFECAYEVLVDIMNSLYTIEPVGNEKPYLTVGTGIEHGYYHADTINDLRSKGYIWQIALGNASVVSKDEIIIKASTDALKHKENKGSVIIYDFMGLECKAFKPITKNEISIYIEQTNQINIFIK